MRKTTRIDTPAAARGYIARGLAPLPAAARAKACTLKGWRELNIKDEEVGDHFQSGDNVGLLLGEPSGGLVDVDLDADEALAFAKRWLPASGMVWGRTSRRASHWAYICPEGTTRKFTDPADGSMLVEIRSSGHQTMAPPSVHPSGEAVTFDDDGEPNRVDHEELTAGVTRVAAGALLARRWPSKGSRHDASLALAGGLLGLGWSEAEAEALIEAVAEEAGDEEATARGTCVASTAETIRSGEQTTGWPRLAEIAGDEVVEKVKGWLGVPSTATGGKPVVVVNDDLDDVTRATWSAIADADEERELFNMAAGPVRVIPSEGEVLVEPLDINRLRHASAERVAFQREGKNGAYPTFPPVDLIKNMLADPHKPLPHLRRIVRIPVLTADGRLLSDTGHDPGSEILFHPQPGVVVPPVPPDPGPAEVEAALRFLTDEVLADFPFASTADRAHAIALLLLPFGRELVDGLVPMHMIEAPTPGTGKGLLVNTVTLPSSGRPIPAMPEVYDEEEWRKRITSTLRGEPEFVVLDNLAQRVDSPSLAAMLTTGVWEDRLLGVSENIRLETKAIFIATANNPTYSSEMLRRTARIRIDAGMEEPHLRASFRHEDQLGWVSANIASIANAALTLWHAWLAAERPPGAQIRGSFESWARVLGGVLQVVGVDGFLETDEVLFEEADEEAIKYGALALAAWRAHRDGWIATTRMADLARETALFSFKTRDGAPAQMGRWLAKQRGRVFDGLSFERQKARTGSFEWHVVVAPGAEPPAEEPDEDLKALNELMVAPGVG